MAPGGWTGFSTSPCRSPRRASWWAAIVAYATCLGEFGAVITFAANIPGQTQTLPLAIYAALQVPGGEAKAAELSMVSLTLALIGLLLSEWLGKRLNVALGR